MKKLLLWLVLTIVLVFSLQSICFAAEPIKTNQKVAYEDTVIHITEPIVNIEGNLYVPIRTFCEQIGYIVDWSPECITLSKNARSSIIEKKDFTYVRDKTYIKVRRLGEILNKEVGYDEKTQTALIGGKLLEQIKQNTEKVPVVVPEKQESTTQNTSGKVVMIDPGHGGSDPGAIGNGVEEKVANLYISQKVQEKLESSGYKVIMTREDDTYVSLSGRYNKANEENVDLFISIHNNSADNTSARGTEVLCNFGGDGEKLAENILNEIVSRISTINRGLKDGSRMAVIRHTDMPAVIVEGLFISNTSDANMLKDTNVLDNIAEGIYQGIIKTLK